jgi:hypothetical protein
MQTSDEASHEKRLATAKARAALLGATLVAIDSDNGKPQFVLTKWALTKCFDDISDVEQTLSRMEGCA